MQPWTLNGRQPWPTEPEGGLPEVPTTIRDLVFAVEADAALPTYEAKARALVDKVPPKVREAALGALTEELLVLRRQWRAAREAVENQIDDATERLQDVRWLDEQDQATATQAAARGHFESVDQLREFLYSRGERDLWRRLAGRDPEVAVSRPYTSRRLCEAPSNGAPTHASPKVLAVSMAWQDILHTEIAMADGTRLAIQDMDFDQLTSVADTLYDLHERIHTLAAAVKEAGVTTPAELPSDLTEKALTA